MRIKSLLCLAVASTLLISCIKRGPNPQDPYESINRKFYKFNMAVDATVLKPPARFYKAVFPGPVRKGVDNFYNNIHMLPTTANDFLQADWKQGIRDSWRFLINSTLGVAGIFDVATGMGLPFNSNDLGLTFAKWGDKNSPYIMIPLLGPSTIRDGMGMTFDYAIFMPYPYLNNYGLMYGLLGVRYVDLRSQMLDTEKLMKDAFDPYAFLRDAYLQNRNYLITGKAADATGSNYVEDSEINDYIDDEPTTASLETNHAAHRTLPA